MWMLVDWKGEINITDALLQAQWPLTWQHDDKMVRVLALFGNLFHIFSRHLGVFSILLLNLYAGTVPPAGSHQP